MFRPLSLFAPRSASEPVYGLSTEDLVWIMGSFCALNHLPFDAGLLIRQFPPPYTTDSLIHAARALGFRIKRQMTMANKVASLNLPCLVLLNDDSLNESSLETSDSIQSSSTASSSTSSSPSHSFPRVRPAIIAQAND
jgi:subfamily B ATP-binding cassette protein HlyB/CyaB